MGFSVETLALAKRYTDSVAIETSQVVIQEAVTQALTESKLYTDKVVGELTQFQVQIVSELPTENINPHTIYFVPINTRNAKPDSYYEFMYIDNEWELIGTTQIDLSNYYTKAEVEKYVLENAYILPTASTSTLGGVKIDNLSIKINDGVISVNEEVTTTTAQTVVDNNFLKISDPEIQQLFD